MHRVLPAAIIALLTACSSDHSGTPMTGPSILQAISVVATARSTCLLTTTHAVYCFGSDSTGTLGRDSVDMQAHPTPVRVLAGQSVTAIAGGGYLMCALTSAGQPWCWGTTDSFTSKTAAISSPSPFAIPGAAVLTSISVGPNFGCGLTSAGHAYCWGENQWGQLGTGDTAVRTSLTPVQGGLTWALITAGLSHACGLTSNATLYCWGDNSDGAIATNAVYSERTPFRLDTAPAFVSLHAGAEYSCGVTLTGAGYCWGFAYSGGLGDSIDTFRSIPTTVAGGIAFSMIAPSRENDVLNVNCGLSTQGTAYCWGYVNNGGLGDPSAPSISCHFATPANLCVFVPVPVSGGLTFTTIAVGDDHTCGVITTGAVYCWGKNDVGQLGTGTTTDSDVPVRVVGFGAS
jgi:alpha-tubulin suppressor-like RCC1 family protein